METNLLERARTPGVLSQALCHFPIYVCVWFDILPDEELTDPAFPPRFIMRTFNALINCNIASLLQELQ